MRVIEEKMCKAVLQGTDTRLGNTRVTQTLQGDIRTANIYLFDNLIAKVRRDDDNGNLLGIDLSMCGWGSVTTRSRLNSLCSEIMGCRPFYQRKEDQYFCGLLYDDSTVLRLDSSDWERFTVFSSWNEIQQFDLDLANSVLSGGVS